MLDVKCLMKYHQNYNVIFALLFSRHSVSTVMFTLQRGNSYPILHSSASYNRFLLNDVFEYILVEFRPWSYKYQLW